MPHSSALGTKRHSAIAMTREASRCSDATERHRGSGGFGQKTKEKPSWQGLLAVGSSLFSFICRRVLIQDQTGESVSRNEARRDPN